MKLRHKHVKCEKDKIHDYKMKEELKNNGKEWSFEKDTQDLHFHICTQQWMMRVGFVQMLTGDKDLKI